ncbi:MAG: hypothetical protein JXQ75_02475 [Phycisphaerae bacterium]|nr:hypothetical protein [Phycisphaerae bacterium]
MAMKQPGKVNLMIAQAAENTWATGLANLLSRLPVDLHWSRTDTEAIRLVASRSMHAAVVDDELPGAGGLDVLRRIRLLGLDMPCLLVCNQPDARLLRQALELDVFSVVQAEANANWLGPMVLKVVRRVCQPDWPVGGGMRRHCGPAAPDGSERQAEHDGARHWENRYGYG